MTPARLVIAAAALALAGPVLAQVAAPEAAASAPATVAVPAPVPEATLGERLRVADPYLEMHTGPGRGFPVFHVAERGAWVSIELRHTDWFKVRTEGGQVGWVQRGQIERTLTEAGGRKTLRDVLLDDYLRRRVEAGAALGRFKSEPLIRFWAGYRLSDTLSAEASLGQVQGVYSGTTLWHVNLLTEPWFDQRLSPFFGIGVGRFNNLPNRSLVDAAPVNASMGNATLGVRYHLSDRFVLRADYTLYSVFLSDLQSREFKAVTAGLSFFF
ncbi:MAG: hypothetical protein KA375_07485 [Vitreoscilla sp.]|nr:hypothetical protein [Vitreoscilla sp.]MBP6675435.1 hypothetical protein [Vitreoscilla sp.]